MLVRQINTLTLFVFAMKVHDAEKIVGYMRMIDFSTDSLYQQTYSFYFFYIMISIYSST